MAVYNGRGGLLSSDGGSNTIGGMTRWNISTTVKQPTGTPANAGNMQVVLTGGPTDFTGSFDFYGKEMPALPGTGYSFVGYNGYSSGGGGTARNATASILCTSMNLTCDVENGGVLSGSCGFGANGALTLTGTGTIPTVGTGSALTTYGGTGCKANWKPYPGGVIQAAADLAGLRSWNLQIECKDAPYVTADDAGVTKRTAGNYSARASVSLYQADVGVLSATATKLLAGIGGVLKLYVNSTEFFGLSYAVSSGPQFGPEAEAGNNNEVTIGFDYSGWMDIAGTLTRGSLLRPDTTAFWS